MANQRNSSILTPTIITINVLIFVLWSLSSESQLSFMMDNFLVSWEALLHGRVWTLVSSVFSHNMFLHLFINMYVLFSFGSFLESVLGPRRFLTFYFVAGIVSSTCHSMVSAWALGKPELPALGASGSISGLLILFSLMFPKQIILLLGIIPVPALIGALLFVGLDIWGLIVQMGGSGLPIGHGAHLGGALTGALYYFLFLRGRLRRRQL